MAVLLDGPAFGSSLTRENAGGHCSQLPGSCEGVDEAERIARGIHTFFPGLLQAIAIDQGSDTEPIGDTRHLSHTYTPTGAALQQTFGVKIDSAQQVFASKTADVGEPAFDSVHADIASIEEVQFHGVVLGSTVMRFEAEDALTFFAVGMASMRENEGSLGLGDVDASTLP